MSPKKVIWANDKKVEKYLFKGPGVQLLTMEKPNYTSVCADILQHHGVVIPYHTLRNLFLFHLAIHKKYHAVRFRKGMPCGD